jgi:hypothetical protein
MCNCNSNVSLKFSVIKSDDTTHDEILELFSSFPLIKSVHSAPDPLIIYVIEVAAGCGGCQVFADLKGNSKVKSITLNKS